MYSQQVNGFTKLWQENLQLKRLQVAGSNFYELDDNTAQTKIDIFVKQITKVQLSECVDMFNTPITGYFHKKDLYYYRNCNVISCLDKKLVYYHGKMPNSFIIVEVVIEPERIKFNINTTRQYMFESRSRLTINNPIEILVNNLILTGSIQLGIMPFHAAAIDIKDRAFLFMGLPNTGKTTTSMKSVERLNGRYLSEDIVFVDVATLKVYGSPYTNTEIVKPAVWSSYPLDVIFSLNNLKDETMLNMLTDETQKLKYLMDMNMYEFHWNEDMVLKSLMLAGLKDGVFSQFEISKKYLKGIKSISEKVSIYEICGKKREIWPDLACDLIEKRI